MGEREVDVVRALAASMWARDHPREARDLANNWFEDAYMPTALDLIRRLKRRGYVIRKKRR